MGHISLLENRLSFDYLDKVKHTRLESQEARKSTLNQAIAVQKHRNIFRVN